jgi:DNA repair exonuclease SbcCD ATPase subunit
MKRIFVSIVAMLFISVLFMACADEKGPAELAMKAAEQAVAATKAEAEKLVPDQVAALESALASAKDKLAKGEFKEALSEAQGLVGKAKDVLAAAQAKKDELTQKWTELSQGLPQMVEAIQGKVDDLSKLKKLPKAITAEKLAEAKSGLEAVKADLAKAQESFKSGNIAEAIAVATAVKEKAVKAMESLGITAPEPAKS